MKSTPPTEAFRWSRRPTHGAGRRTPEPAELVRAGARVGNTPEAGARWLLHFAEQPLAQLTPPEWRRLGWEGSAFLNAIAPLDRRDWTTPLREKVIGDCQEWLRKGLQEIAKPTGWSFDVNVRYRFFLRDSKLIGGRTPGQMLSDREWFRVAVYETLRTERHRFRICANASCGTPFIARKRQAYCSQKCSQAVRTREFRARHPEKVREWRRAASAVRRGRRTRS